MNLNKKLEQQQEPHEKVEEQKKETKEKESDKPLSEKMSEHHSFLKDQLPKFHNEGKPNEANQGQGQITLLEQLIPEVRKYEQQITGMTNMFAQITVQLENFSSEIKNAIGVENEE